MSASVDIEAFLCYDSTPLKRRAIPKALLGWIAAVSGLQLLDILTPRDCVGRISPNCVRQKQALSMIVRTV